MTDPATLKILTTPACCLESLPLSQWLQFIEYALNQIQQFFGHKPETEPLDNACVQNGFCIDITHCATSNPLVHWKGILGASVIDNELRVNLLVFLFSGAERLSTRSGKHFAEFVFKRKGDSEGCWEFQDWYEDLYGEYDQIA
ncbi:MAG: hypothetical protein ACK5YR_13745 [Pirellula sp.]|jgi:hypothetical protein